MYAITMITLQQMEKTINELLNLKVKTMDEQIVAIRKECRTGLRSVHENLTSMKELYDSKLLMLEDRVKKDLGRIRKLIVLT